MRYGTISTRTLSVALGALLAAVLSSVPAHASPPGPSAPDQPDVIVAQAAPGKKLHFPNMERRNDGSLVAVAREGEGPHRAGRPAADPGQR